MSPSTTRLYWFCAGEIMTLGGALKLSGQGPEPGCRPITVQRATELWGFYALKGRVCRDAAARRHCEICAEELCDAIVRSAAWRRAA